MPFDTNNKIVQLCAQGMNYEGEPEKARPFFQQAWAEATTHFEKFVAAHYVARQQPSVNDKLKWDETALQFALLDNQEDIRAAYPSLYLNSGKGYEDLRDFDRARKHYQLAQSFVGYLPNDGYGEMIRSGIRNGLERVKDEPQRG
ncbi:rRNA adenine methyltransferase [Larkinella terrae]|uniref:rRNA adenine methyltransferase n=1 Tax=Larkinella terrae TaxID=2025311 RepID=A0A7K0EPJ3_9BACT|nr:rRNA adenine methyltransferase [Larkinella terrae]MRS63652.1 rRNA adenine methyltransferase [Larkinella terrae]